MRRSIAVTGLTVLFAGSAQGQVPSRMAQQPASVTEFVVRVENVSTGSTLKLSNGTTAPAPTAPVLWLLHTKADPIFTPGDNDRGIGLEQLAETGNPAILAGALEGGDGVVEVGAVDTPLGDADPGPITPGKAFEVRFRARADERLTLAMMFGQSNDLFYAPTGDGIRLFDEAGRPSQGDITAQFVLWDAGTEVNEEPGAGADQAPRQTSPDAGTPERKPVATVHDQYTYPRTAQVIRVTLTPVGGSRN